MHIDWMNVLRAIAIVVAGIYGSKLLSAVIARAVTDRLSANGVLLVRRGVSYAVIAVAVASALDQLGFDLSVLLGAAGIATVAVGFAAQTTASNFISGVFLFAERPFGVGDVITVGGTTGEVLSIDPLSVKLRTFDNIYVRVPNETVLKSESSTLSRFPIRRTSLVLGVAYKEDLARVREVIMEVAEAEPTCLENPAPALVITGHGASSVDLELRVWALSANLFPLRDTLFQKIKARFDDEGIEIPFPHLRIANASLAASALPRTSE